MLLKVFPGAGAMTTERLSELLDIISDVACCPAHDEAIAELMKYRDDLEELWRKHNELKKQGV